MRFFIDTANVEEIKKANRMGFIAGVTTNPSLVAKKVAILMRSFKKSHPLLTDRLVAK